MSDQSFEVLVVDDDPISRKSISALLRPDGYLVTEADSAEGAMVLLETREFPLIVSDVYLPGLSGLDLLKQVKTRTPETAVVLLTGYGRIEDAVAGMRLGAYEYITKPLDDERFLRTLEHALERHRLRRENAQLRERLGDSTGFEHLVGNDHGMRRVFELIRTISDTEATVLITGETGTGKSTIARAIHYRSRRAAGPLVEVSCGALAPNLLESELFGHVRGAFTGAVSSKLGKFDLAAGGTILLDEIDTLDLALQVKLLRVLQERRFEPVGGVKTNTANVRVIAASNQDLEVSVREGAFRQDLYYRLNVISIALPPLRERSSDIPALATDFLRRFAAQNHREIHALHDSALDRLMRYDWPGNIRELENAVERAVILCHGSELTEDHLPAHIVHAAPASGNHRFDGPLKTALDRAEREIIIQALEAHAWSRQDAAAALDISRSTLFHKMRKYDLLSPTEPPPRS